MHIDVELAGFCNMESQSSNPHKNAPYIPSKTIHRQIAEIVQIALEFCLLLLQITYYNIESIYRAFWPIKAAPVKDKVVLITGAGHGIGRELALQYASEGSVLVLWDINQTRNEETSRIIKKNGGHNIHSYTVDVAERHAVQKMAKLVEEEVGDVSILINNAGIMPAHPLEQHTEDEIKRIMNINVFAHFWTIQAFLPSMKRNNHGHIVALSSIAGLAGLPNLVPYCASKFAVRGLMEGLLEELNENPSNKIRTTTVCPFMVNTGLCKKPYVRFENALNVLQPAFVAQQIMHAQRIGLNELTIPKFLMTVTNITRLFPVKVGTGVKKFFQSGVYSDL